MKNIHYKFWNIVVIKKKDSILLIDRIKGDFSGFVPPGGKVDFPETFIDAVFREAYEETGLKLEKADFRGISGFINKDKKEQFVFLDYYCEHFSGEVKADGPEGKCAWYPIDELSNMNIKSDIRKRIEYILSGERYEYQMLWDEAKRQVRKTKYYPNDGI